MRTALVEEFQCVLWKIVATAVLLAMRSRLRPDWNTALIGCIRTPDRLDNVDVTGSLLR